MCNWCGYRPLCPAWKHLYRKRQDPLTQQELDPKLKEYFAIKKLEKQHEKRLSELQSDIKKYMEQENVTRVFSEDGVITKKTIQRYAYDYEKIKSLLSPLGKWEELLKADDAKLKRMMKEVPEEIRSAIEEARTVAKEYAVLAASEKKIGMEISDHSSSESDESPREA